MREFVHLNLGSLEASFLLNLTHNGIIRHIMCLKVEQLDKELCLSPGQTFSSHHEKLA